ncbi:uncharacterized protein LOC130990895 [Salvia miltiorrhiza]|uniref:uncharacterized protein LOC130990895 n=1 Tax=Salvia miltiorrhiza TaxID=226208 RepID=UPI0025ACB41B|nr:uncharacterized protein LOC130990895 [Salvia miltiorrhiza]
MEDVLIQAWAQIKWEEDQYNMQRVFPPERLERDYMVDRRSGCDNRDRRSEPYTPSHRGNRGRGDYDQAPSTRPHERAKLPEYLLSISPVEAVTALMNLGDKVSWPEKMRAPPDQRDRSKWCDFHSDHGHRTDECIALRLEVASLLKKGHLTNYLTDKGKQTLHGVTHSAAKRHTRQARSSKSGVPPPGKTGTTDPTQLISFATSESDKLLHPHHDALVISVFIANCLTKRVLIDNGSSANILFYSAYREMGLDESKLIKKAPVLVGFSGESTTTVGEIDLPVYAEGVNLSTRFLVVDAPSAYNIILGRLWIHEMEAVPSTYHQVLKFPTKWGVKEIKGEHKDSRACYQTTMKAKRSPL